MTRTSGAQIGCQRPSRFWGLGCPKIYHEAEDTLDGCGEHVRAQVLVAVVDGSSPRVWGTRLYYQSPQRPRRFIPTGVGNTATIYDELYKYAVHPHGCGEHFYFPDGYLVYQRFIPTGVGNTLSLDAHIDMYAVHPHGCGEHALYRMLAPMTRGSSPRVWGTRVLLPDLIVTTRFIPTGVGNTMDLSRMFNPILRFIPTGVGNT